MKYVAGQTVMISNDLHLDMPSPTVNSDMMKHKGKTTKIRKVKKYGQITYALEIDNGYWDWADFMLQPVPQDENELLDMLVSGSIDEKQYKELKKQT